MAVAVYRLTTSNRWVMSINRKEYELAIQRLKQALGTFPQGGTLTIKHDGEPVLDANIDMDSVTRIEGEFEITQALDDSVENFFGGY